LWLFAGVQCPNFGEIILNIHR